MTSPYIFLKNFKAVIFDWDGVIADTHLDFKPVRKHFLNGGTAPLLEAAQTLPEPVKKRFMQAIIDEEMRGAALSRPVEGIAEFISELNCREIPWCVMSRNCRESIELAAKTIGFSLPPLTFGREAPHVKPDPLAMQDAAQALRTPPEQCLVIGDYLYELLAARRAGMRCILVRDFAPHCQTYADAWFKEIPDLLKAYRHNLPITPWEYHPLIQDQKRRLLEENFAKTVHFDLPLSDGTLHRIARLARQGFGAFSVSPGRTVTGSELHGAPLVSRQWYDASMASLLRDLFSKTFPLISVHENEEGIPLSVITKDKDFL